MYESTYRIHKFIDTIGSCLWFVMDASWMFGLKIISVMLVLPCVVLALAGFWQPRLTFSKGIVNSALCCWLLMNVFWMLNDFHVMDGMTYAKSFFALGMTLILVTLIHDRNKLSSFRRFK